MRNFWFSALALLNAGCTAPSYRLNAPRSEIDFRYGLSIFTWDESNLVIDKGLQSAKLAALPSSHQSQRLLLEAGTSKVQIGARCAIRNDRLLGCDRFIVSPSSDKTIRRSRILLSQLRISSASLRRTNLPPNQAAIEIQVVAKNSKPEYAQECILVRFCGVPTPPPPPPPPTRDH